jgi:hypothetical protein
MYILIGACIFWLILLTFVFLKLRNHYYNLISTTKKERLDDILDSLIIGEKMLKVEVYELKKKLDGEMKKSALHLQKVGLVRFNPFGTVGGEQSFVAAFVDQENSGIVLNFIYTKEGLRVYTKRVKKGVGVEYELSKEEEIAIEKSI